MARKTPTPATISAAAMGDYQQGWRDCRTYAGEAEDGSAEYKRGFRACLRAYHTARNWIDVPTEGVSDE